MERINNNDIKIRLDYINKTRKLCDSDAGYMTFEGCSGGGYRICSKSTGGGQRDKSPKGTKRDIYNYLCAYMNGMDDMKEGI